MPFKIAGKIVHITENSFVGKDGKDVEYFVNVIAHEQGTISVNSQKDYSESLNVPAEISLVARQAEGSKFYKFSIASVDAL